MSLAPANLNRLAQSLAEANRARLKIDRVDLCDFQRVVEHTPEDMTVTVETGLTLASLQAVLARHGQWLPIDPPNPEQLAIRDLIDTNVSGPRRFAFGTIRDHLLGVRVALADGRIIHSGGKVVKNVAGYDLMKLFVGAHASLGIVVEASFKLLPLPEAEHFVQARCASLTEAGNRIDSVLASAVTPVVLDLHTIANLNGRPSISLILGFAGTREEVAWQLGQAETLGFTEPASLDYNAVFHRATSPALRRISVLPSRLGAALQALGSTRFIARAGNGVIYYRGGAEPSRPALPMPLMERIKVAFDPNSILPELPL